MNLLAGCPRGISGWSGSDRLRTCQRHHNTDFFMIPRDFVASSLSRLEANFAGDWPSPPNWRIIGQGALLSQR